MSNGKHETIADIVAALRAIAYIQTAESPSSVLSFAKRIEAAAKRERKAGAEAAQICGEIGEMVGREATCKESVTNCNQLGNAAALREALDKLLGLFDSGLVEYSDSCDNSDTAQIQYVIDKAGEALEKPPRNCDVGTPEECAERFYAFCGEYRFKSGIKGMCSSLCPCISCCDMCHCLTKWSQMPYEEGGAE